MKDPISTHPPNRLPFTYLPTYYTILIKDSICTHPPNRLASTYSPTNNQVTHK
jgi:hypothetical protein